MNDERRRSDPLAALSDGARDCVIDERLGCDLRDARRKLKRRRAAGDVVLYQAAGEVFACRPEFFLPRLSLPLDSLILIAIDGDVPRVLGGEEEDEAKRRLRGQGDRVAAALRESDGADADVGSCESLYPPALIGFLLGYPVVYTAARWSGDDRFLSHTRLRVFDAPGGAAFSVPVGLVSDERVAEATRGFTWRDVDAGTLAL